MRRFLIAVVCTSSLLGLAWTEAAEEPNGRKAPPPGMVWDVSKVWENLDLSKGNGKWEWQEEKLDFRALDTTDDGKGKVTAIGPGFPKEGPENAFDNSRRKYCIRERSIWIQYQYADGARRRVIAYSIKSANDYPKRDPRQWKLLGSNDGKTWYTLDARADQNFFTRHWRRYFKVASPSEYNIYKLVIEKNHGDVSTQLEEIELLAEAPRGSEAEVDLKKLLASAKNEKGYKQLFKEDLSNATFRKGSWVFEDGVLTPKGGGDIWTKERYGDFALDLEFKCEKNTNSGVFLRCKSLKEWLHTAIEVQILQPDSGNKRHICGAIYDCLAPTKRAVKAPGEWNHFTIIAKANRILVVLNGEKVTDMDLNLWTEPHRNPDGSRNKFKYAYRDLAREGLIGLQYHGHPVWFRNVRIKEL